MTGSSSFDPLASESPLIVYIDFKSPYAFVATAPTYEIGDQLGIEIDWRPLTLDIPSYLGSARLDDRDRVVAQDRTSEQWTAIKYAYRDCRRYASLSDTTLRGTVKIWDTSVAHIGMMWAKRQGPEVLRAYTDGIYRPFWRRELDAEDPEQIVAVLTDAGAETSGFEAFLTGEGRLDHDTMQSAIFEAGIFGVPSYVVEGELFFGRENLPMVRWILKGRRGAAPDVGYRHFGDKAKVEPVAKDNASIDSPGNELPVESRLLVAIDFAQPESYLATAPTYELASDLGIEIDWLPFTLPPLSMAESADADPQGRGARHRRFRAQYRARDLERYAKARGLILAHPTRRSIDRPTDSSLAGMGLLWLKEQAATLAADGARSRQEIVDGYLDRVLEGLWSGQLDIENLAAIQGVLNAVGADGSDFDPEKERPRLEQVARQLREAGVFGAPAYLVNGELFLGRAQLPMVRWLLEGRAGPPPI